MKKRKQPWFQKHTRNAQRAQTYDNNIREDNIWYTYMTYRGSHRPYQTQPYFQNQYYGVPYTNEYNGYETYNYSEIINSSSDDSEAESKPTALQEKTVIKKEGLYKDVSSLPSDNDLYRDNTSNASTSANTGTWTEAFWQKQDDNISETSGPFSTARQSLGKSKKPNRENKLEKSLNKMLAKPVEMSKGRSLLEKMGWQGGGLGKDGDGIVEPIAPKATYAVNTIGLGHPNETNNEKKKMVKPTKKKINKPPLRQFNNKGNFCTNLLLNILEFVRNDRTIEMFFDIQLRDRERKRIHQIVEKIRDLDNLDDFEGFKDKDLDIVKDIWVHNMYELWTQSEGKRTNRQLCLYKEAQEHVYLVTPDDLRDDAKEIDDAKKKDQDNKSITNSNETKEKSDGNQKERVITNDDDDVIYIKTVQAIVKESYVENMNKYTNNDNALKEIECEETKVTETMLAKIIGYFKEFSDDAIYTQFRCLGPFNDEEVENLKLFFDICMRKDDNTSQEKLELLQVLDNAAFVFDVQEDINGSMLICKSERNQLPAQ